MGFEMGAPEKWRLVREPQWVSRLRMTVIMLSALVVFMHKENLLNGDMVGHTGDIEATVVACKAADDAVKMILDAIEQVGGIYVVTADHGLRNKSGQPHLDKSGNIQILTSHTLQPVPIAIDGPGLAPGVRYRNDAPEGGIANVAAAVMNLHGF